MGPEGTGRKEKKKKKHLQSLISSSPEMNLGKRPPILRSTFSKGKEGNPETSNSLDFG